ncbi:hypothetical protein NHH82_22990 [Oxalobacteraceae bacterium OTU3REALA1]|jgi:hypothetical protein|nr:hypothetical protein NHH82_22990 [Oxalobacteraceae bacterium OTU3REALA1]
MEINEWQAGEAVSQAARRGGRVVRPVLMSADAYFGPLEPAARPLFIDELGLRPLRFLVGIVVKSGLPWNFVDSITSESV